MPLFPSLRWGIRRADALSPSLQESARQFLASKIFPVVRHIAQVFSQVLGPFQASAFHPFIERLVQILKSIKLIGISWDKKGGPKNLQPLFCWESDLIPVFSDGIKDKDDEKIIKQNKKDKPNGQDVFETNKFIT